MCGRFTQKLTWREIHDLYRLLPADSWFEWQKRGAGKAPRFLSSADKKATPRPSMR